MDKWIMIVNPASATAATADSWESSRKMLTEAGLAVEPIVTGHPGDAIDIAREAAARGERHFIAVGGDGTIHEVMTGLLRYADAEGVDLNDFTLAVLPYGTGNDWIRTSGIPKDMTEAAACIVRGKTAREDVVRLTFENGVFCMANVAGVGLDANICYNTNALKKKGYKGDLLYKMVAPYSIFSKQRRPVEIVCDGEPVFKGKLFSVVIGNGLYRGGGIRQNQEGGDWADGLLEVSIMPGVHHFKAVQLMMHALSGDFAVQKGIITRRVRKMTLTPLGTPDRVESDGEIPGTLPLTVEVTGQQIHIIVP